MQWSLLAFGVIGGLRYHLCEAICWSFIRRPHQFSDPCCCPGCTAVRSSRIAVSLLRCGGEIRGMNSLCAGSGLKFRVWRLFSMRWQFPDGHVIEGSLI